MTSRLASAALCAGALAGGVVLGSERWGEPLRAAALSGFECRSVALRGLAYVSATELTRAARLAAGTPLLEVATGEVEARLREHPWVLEVRARRLPPFQLLVDVTERRPVALAAATDGLPFLVDRSGTRFAPAGLEHQDTLPLLNGLAAEPEAAAPEVAQALGVADLLHRHGLPEPARIWLGSTAAHEGLALELRGETARILLGSARAADGLRRLARSRAAGLPEVAAATRIDLRFAGRMVLRGPSPPGGGEAAAERGGATPPNGGPAG